MSYTTKIGYTPVFFISKGGDDITGNFSDCLTAMTVNSYEGEGDSDTVEIELDDRDWIVQAPNVGESSATLSISIGYAEGALYDMGTFEVDEIHFKGPPKAIVLSDNSLGANTNAKAPVITSFEGKTLGDIIGSIAQAAGVSPVVDPGLASINIPYLNVYSSHQHLLQELERRFGGLAKFEDGKLSFTQRGTGLNASGNPLGTFTLGSEYLASWDIKSNHFRTYSKVRVSYIDRNLNQLIWLQSKVSRNPGSQVPHMMKQPFGSQQEAQAAADAAMSELNRGTKIGTIVLAKGDPSIRGGQKLTIAGCRDRLDDSYIVSSAVHTFRKESGIVTSLSVYTEDSGSDMSTGETPSTAPSLDDMASEASTVPLGQGGIGHQ